MRQQCRVLLVGLQHQIHHGLPVAAATRSDQQIRSVRHVCGFKNFTPQIPGPVHAPARRIRQRQPGRRIIHILDTVDPCFIVKGLGRFHGALAGPLRGQDFGLVQHIAQAKHNPGLALSGQPFKAWQQLAPEPGRLLVNDKQVRFVLLQRGLDQPRPQVGCRIDVHAAGLTDIGPIAQLFHARQANVIHRFGKGKTASNRAAGQDDGGCRGAAFGQGRGQSPTAAQMTKAERVVTVQNNAARACPNLRRRCRC